MLTSTAIFLSVAAIIYVWREISASIRESGPGPVQEAWEVPHFHVDRMPVWDYNIFWKHTKSGGLYTILHDQATREDDLEPVVVYRGVGSGRIWVRPHAEFFDGRFEQVEMKD